MVGPQLIVKNQSSQLLQQFIEGFYIYHFRENQDVYFHPKGIFEIVFQSGACFNHNTAYTSGWEARPTNFVGGLHNKAYTVRSEAPGQYCISVAFKPHAPRHFINMPLHEFRNALVTITDVWGDDANALLEALDKAVDIQQKIKIIEDFLITRFSLYDVSRIDQALDYIEATRGFISVQDIASKVGLSEPHFRKRFKEDIGLSPAQYCKIKRMHASMELLEQEPGRSLTELTYLLGYFDQSHFIKDFKSIAGSSPKFFRQALSA